MRMRKERLIKTGMTLSVVSMVLVFMTGLCMADGMLEDSLLGKALDELDRGLDKIIGLPMPGDSARGSIGTDASGEAAAEDPVPKLKAEPVFPDIPGSDPLTEALDPSQAPGLDALSGALDPSQAPGLDALSGALDPSQAPGLDALTGALDPSNLPGLDSLPGMDGFERLPELSGMDPMEVLQILDKPDELLIVLTVDELLQATLGLGKNLEKAPLLEAQLVLFDALSAEGKVGLRKIRDDAFLVPLELYLKYRIGDEAWKELLDLVGSLELSFPGAGMIPDGVQTIVDTIYKYILKPILSPFPIYREIKPGGQPEEVAPPPPTQNETSPGTAVLGEEATPGGSGDHLPLTGAELKILLAVLVALAVFIPILRKLEKTVGKRMD
ncbi:MAG: hypothetical protein QME88_10260 [Actinomycetota bacterium]|nr:hypothetical protein [Actinomycetota bacterium]